MHATLCYSYIHELPIPPLKTLFMFEGETDADECLISTPGGNCHNSSAGLSSLYDDHGHEAVWASVDKYRCMLLNILGVGPHPVGLERLHMLIELN